VLKDKIILLVKMLLAGIAALVAADLTLLAVALFTDSAFWLIAAALVALLVVNVIGQYRLLRRRTSHITAALAVTSLAVLAIFYVAVLMPAA
jgi:hypothetical protein